MRARRGLRDGLAAAVELRRERVGPAESAAATWLAGTPVATCSLTSVSRIDVHQKPASAAAEHARNVPRSHQRSSGRALPIRPKITLQTTNHATPKPIVVQ